MEIDWFSKGHFNYRVIRGCVQKPTEETDQECYEAASSHSFLNDLSDSIH